MLKKILLNIIILTQYNTFMPPKNNLENVSSNTLLVSITNEESLKLTSYSKKDFSKNYIINIEDLTSSYKKQIDNNSYDNKDSFNRIFKIEIDSSKTNIESIKKKLEKLNFVEEVDYDYINTIAYTSVNDAQANNQWAISKIQLNQAWDIEKGDESIKIGIIDGGIDSTHPDLIGRVDSSLSKSFVAASHGTALQDYNGHGTHVAGIIGGCPNDYGYIAGVCWYTTLVSLKTQKTNGQGLNSDLASAINYANEIGVELLNISINSESYSIAIKNAINNFPGLIVCSAGNYNKNTDNDKLYPNEYDSNNLICVGNSNINDQRESSSDYGKTTVDLFAPGHNILSDVPFSINAAGVEAWNGTSMAAPYVTGVAALLKAQNPDISWAQVKTRILDNVEPVNVFNNLCVSGGRLNAYSAQTNLYHNHEYIVQKYNSQYHKSYCSPCGHYIYENHNWTLTSLLSYETNIVERGALQRYTCIECGETTMF